MIRKPISLVTFLFGNKKVTVLVKMSLENHFAVVTSMRVFAMELKTV